MTITARPAIRSTAVSQRHVEERPKTLLVMGESVFGLRSRRRGSRVPQRASRLGDQTVMLRESQDRGLGGRYLRTMEVFVSYSNHDDAAVRSLVQDLQRGRQQVWLDQHLGGGQAWWAKIHERIRACTVFVFALSDNSLRSKLCQAESQYAQALGLPILPVQVGDVTDYRADPITKQLIDYRNPTASSGIALLGALHELAAQRRDLPDPLPDAPPVPYEYLLLLGKTIDGPESMRPSEQKVILTQLREALRYEEEPGVRDVVRNLLADLRRRVDVTYDVLSEIDSILQGDSAHSRSDPPTFPAQRPDSELTRAEPYLEDGPSRGKSMAAPRTPRMPNGGDGIFISYRRGNESSFAGRLYDNLRLHYGADQVFIDVDNIEFGVDFTKVIDQKLAQCRVLLVIVGKDWTSVAGSDGRPRLEDPNDFVRIEVQAALSRDDVRVIPIFVNGAKAPSASELPATLASLTRRNGLTISHEAFHSDFNRLRRALDGVMSRDA
jgi:TIR domain